MFHGEHHKNSPVNSLVGNSLGSEVPLSVDPMMITVTSVMD